MDGPALGPSPRPTALNPIVADCSILGYAIAVFDHCSTIRPADSGGRRCFESWAVPSGSATASRGATCSTSARSGCWGSGCGTVLAGAGRGRRWRSRRRACRASAGPSRASCCSCTARRASSRRSTPSPRRPQEIRGEFGCIASSVPGLNVCERLPRLSQVMDKVTLIRSVTHPYPIHGVAFATTGIPADRRRAGAESPRHRATGRSSARRWIIVDGRRLAEGRGPAVADPAQPGAAVGVQQPTGGRGAPLGPVWRVPGPGV